jgi:crossover junction endodeoxyribonuclease RuvC
VTALEFGRILPRRNLARPAALAALTGALEELLARLSPEVVVIETSFAARFPKAALALAETRGALLVALGRWGGEVVEVEPARVKAAIVGYGRAEKRQVAYVVRHALALPAEPPADAADALAIALCHLRSTLP